MATRAEAATLSDLERSGLALASPAPGAKRRAARKQIGSPAKGHRKSAKKVATEVSPLIETKVHPPAPQPDLVTRQRLEEEIEGAWASKLTLVDAPAGSGKTMLLQSWCARTDGAVAWVSLDAEDDDPTRLWTYIATAVDRIRSGLGRMALARLGSPGVPIESVVDELLNGVSVYDQPLAIVLDDLHLLKNGVCLQSLEHALDHLPSRARVIASSRSDPQLPLSRFRAGGALREIRAGELAFTPEEARELLVERSAIALDDTDVALLVDRTEGWPAGLRLAALWLRELEDPRAGVKAFHADHRHVADYLTGEVLDTLTADARRFLVETSVLGSFSAAECDAVLGRRDSKLRLRELEQANGFLIALDAQGEWFRYHHLFGELLQLELASADASAPPRLHVQASEWCRDHGRIEDALEHAAAAGDARLAVAELADKHLALLRTGRLTTVLSWCKRLPNELLLERPELPVAAALAAGLARSPVHVRHQFAALAERARSERPDEWTLDHEAELGVVQTSWVEHDLATTIELARRTVEVARDRHGTAVSALANLAFLLYLDGESADAALFASEALARPEAEERPHGLVLALTTASLIASDSGRSAAAEHIAREALEAAKKAGLGQAGSAGAARVALAAALARQGKLREAERQAVQAVRLRWQSEPEIAHLHALLVLADTRARRGRLERAVEDLGEATQGLETFTDAGRLHDFAVAVETTLAKCRATTTAPSDPPSDAELTVLPLLATDLSLREIGARLYLSHNTVKTHTQALYRKLESHPGTTQLYVRRHSVSSVHTIHPGDPSATLCRPPRLPSE